MEFLFSCIYFYLPVAFSIFGAAFGRYIPVLRNIDHPVDFGININGHRLIGDHKKIGGLVSGILSGLIAGIMKYYIFDQLFSSYLILDINFFQSMLLYTSLILAALSGDLVKSIIKRSLDITPHRAWIPFDELDHSIASMLLAIVVFNVQIKVAATVIVVYFFIHLISNVVLFMLKIKSVPY